MYLNQQLRDSIEDTIEENIQSIPGLSSPMIDKIMDSVADAIDTAIAQNEEDMKIAEKAGPPMWHTLHWIAQVADNESRPELYRALLNIYLQAHPCKDVCRAHLRKNLTLCNINSYASCFEHSVALHNRVNAQLGKPQFSKIQAMEEYSLDCDTCIFPAVGKHNVKASEERDKTKQTVYQQYRGSQTYY